MTNFDSATGLLGTVVVAGTNLIALKLVTDFVGGSIKQTQKSMPKSKKYNYMNYGYGNYNSKKSKKQDIFSIKF